MRTRIVAHTVRIRHRNGFEQGVVSTIEGIAHAPAPAVAHEDAVQVARKRDAVNLLLISDLLHELVGFEVHNVQGVVALVRYKQPRVVEVRPQVIESPKYALQLNDGDTFERQLILRFES